jgi:hypothetical protein
MPKALANRLMHIEVEIDVDSWIKWAKENNINDTVIKFISNNKQYLMNDNSYNDNLAYATPRTWEMVSKIISNSKNVGCDIETLIAGLVGKDVSLEFMRYVVVNGNLPNVKDIFAGKITYAELTDTQNDVLKNIIINYAKSTEDMSQISKSIKYIVKMPYDYALYIFKNYIEISDEVKATVEKAPEFKKWIEKADNNEKV